ncbi:hypothetical protein ALC57_06385 [Trachymyrmex cornetzi]|uniref:MULE transposase domain-containing protein n=1 Tax=Trachymyrmex cornetzi TaxID=471704 RepID=A0A151J8X4_9HYME|nr:hypothetical protein ALC57_06385 [Trachymyrmex cornetzi]
MPARGRSGSVLSQFPIVAHAIKSDHVGVTNYVAVQRPETPKTIVELDAALTNYQPVQNIYKGTVIPDDGYVGNHPNLRPLLFVSITFLTLRIICFSMQMVPRVPSFAQLYTIHVRYIDTGIAVLFVLCESVVLRRWKTLGLSAVPKKILKLTMALPLAPADMFEQGLQIIQEEADAVSAEHPVVLQFTVYLRRTWLPLKDKVSVYGTSIRTNNLVESFHFVIFRKLGGIHPNIWIFLRTYCLLLLLLISFIVTKITFLHNFQII